MNINLQEIPEVPELDATEDFTDLMWSDRSDLDLFMLLSEARKELAHQAEDRLAA